MQINDVVETANFEMVRWKLGSSELLK